MWYCYSTTQVSPSTHSFQLNKSHLKPVKCNSFILLNPALHDRTQWCGVWCVVREGRGGWEQSTEHSIVALAEEQERRMASGQVKTDRTNTTTRPTDRPTIAASQQHHQSSSHTPLSIPLLRLLDVQLTGCCKMLNL